jgi:hypothetical protein
VLPEGGKLEHSRAAQKGNCDVLIYELYDVYENNIKPLQNEF